MTFFTVLAAAYAVTTKPMISNGIFCLLELDEVYLRYSASLVDSLLGFPQKLFGLPKL